METFRIVISIINTVIVIGIVILIQIWKYRVIRFQNSVDDFIKSADMFNKQCREYTEAVKRLEEIIEIHGIDDRD